MSITAMAVCIRECTTGSPANRPATISQNSQDESGCGFKDR
jgi:hypothetical protein